MVKIVEVTYYARTGYSLSDEPESDAVIDLNEHWTDPIEIKEADISNLTDIKVNLTDEELDTVDYIKLSDVTNNEKRYYFVVGHRRVNEKTVYLNIVLDAFASVGLNNIAFFGNIIRRSLSAAERANYPLLAEPWAPKRPLKTRRIILDLNVNKAVKLPSHISTQFEEELTTIEDTETIQVPNSPLGGGTTPDSLSISADLPMLYPNAANDTSHIINTPWGSISYTTPYEAYLTLSGTALSTFLQKAKKANALDLLGGAYYVPSPGDNQTVTLSEISNANIKNPKASKYYTTITIRSLAANSAQTYGDNDINMQYEQPLTVVIVPDKNGGMYVLPTTLRDTGKNAYTYLDGVYSPFETVVYNAVGDTPAKFAADGTTILNTALNNLFQTYINKVNALQYENMQAKYFKDVGVVKGVVMSFAAELLGSTSTTETTTEGYWQNSTVTTEIPQSTQTATARQTVPYQTQTQKQTATTASHNIEQTSSTSMPTITGTQSSTINNPQYTQSQGAYSYTVPEAGGTQRIPAITTTVAKYDVKSTTSTTQASHTISGSTTVKNPAVTQSVEGTITTPGHTIETSTTTTIPQSSQTSEQQTWVEPQTTTSVTTQDASSRSVEEGNAIAVEGAGSVYEVDAWSTLKTMLFGGYRNEVHSFMLGNINDYLNRWVSIQNDMHNGKVANLFKNVTLVGNYNDTNKLAGKYEILVASLQPEDEANFDLFLEHFGHAVDEYSDILVTDAGGNFNYTMVGDDAIIANSVLQKANASILNQFRTGVRVWKTLIRPENY